VAALTKAVLIDRDRRPPLGVPVMFNPPEYELVRSNLYAEIGVPGLGSSLVQFIRGNAQTLTTTFFFDTTDTGLDVRTHTGLVVTLTQQRPHTHAPPRLLFLWGSLAFPCVLERVAQRFTLFNPAGLPLRAELSVSLRGDDALETLLARIPLESSDKTKMRVLRAGESLSSVAGEEYGDSRLWRDIAAASGVDNPFRCPPGTVLTIPVVAGTVLPGAVR
jgi:nucleoid-associated protein YgaU